MALAESSQGNPPLVSMLIRADGNGRIGTGHVMRSIALAEACRSAGGAAAFLMSKSASSLHERVRSEGFRVHTMAASPGSPSDARQTIRLARRLHASWVVADGYGFNARYQSQVTSAALRLLLVDDYGHASHYSANLILNQNLSASPEFYSNREPTAEMLLGPRFALLRDEFLVYRNWRRTMPAVGHKVLVTLGGSDPDNVTAKVLVALDDVDVEVRTVVGGGYSHPLPSPSVIRDARNMAEHMAWADVAIAAGGTTSWELAFMGLPAIVLVLAENQLAIAAALARAGVSHDLGVHSDVSGGTIVEALLALLAQPSRREAMSHRGRALVDGRGRERVVALLTD